MGGVSIVIPVYGQWSLVKMNVEKNFEFDQDNIDEVIIVDDCSLEVNPYDFHSKVKIIRNVENKGYSGTVNVGLRAAISEIVILLDSDAHPTNSYISKLKEVYEDSTVGCVGFKTIDEAGKDTGNFDFEPTLIGFIAGQQLHSKFKRFNFFSKKRILPFSCAVSFRKKCLIEMNYLDAMNFPVLDADNDLSMRIHRSDWKLIFVKELGIFHKGGNSIPRNHKRVLLYHKSRWRLLEKYGLIKSRKLAKKFLGARIFLEIIVLKVLVLLKRDGIKYEDRLKGRKQLLREIEAY